MSSTHAIVIPVTGPVETHHVDDSLMLDFLHRHCEGVADVVRLGGEHGELSLWVNDTGLLDGLEPNLRVMALAEKFGRLGQMLVGPGVVTGGPNRETGEDLPMTDEQLAFVLGVVTA